MYMDLYDYKLQDGFLLDASGFSNGGGRYPENEIFPLKRCMFMGLATWCPNNPQIILHDLYGKGMKGLAPRHVCRNGSWYEAKYR